MLSQFTYLLVGLRLGSLGEERALVQNLVLKQHTCSLFLLALGDNGLDFGELNGVLGGLVLAHAPKDVLVLVGVVVTPTIGIDKELARATIVARVAILQVPNLLNLTGVQPVVVVVVIIWVELVRIGVVCLTL